MSILDDVLKNHRKRIIEREEAAFREMLRAYESVERELNRQVRELQQKVQAAIEKGETISPSWFSREQRLKSLLDQVKSEIARFGRTASPIISREQRAAFEIAFSHSDEIFNLTANSPLNIGSMLDPRVVENAVGFMGDGSPLLNYFEEQLAPAVAEKLRSEVVNAAALGTPFSTVARRLREAGDITRSRALATARTEVNRVRRETTRQIYQENDDIITGWEWVAAKSPRTCPACLALDGKIFKLKDPFPQHVNCRCTMIPVIDGVPRPPRELGREWFARQSDAVKAQIIGVDGLAAYKEGLVELKDFVGWKTSKQFGRSIYTRPLSQILFEKPIAERIIRTPRNIQVSFDDDVEDTIEEILGIRLSANEIGGLVGALDGSRIDVTDFGDGINFTIQNPLISQQVRTLDLDYAGRPFMHNAMFRTSRTAPKGTGLKSFATQVLHAERFGVAYIDTEAVGDYASSKDAFRWNGYYTWARMGYNARLTENDWKDFPATFRGIADLNELFLQTNGKFVWRYKGKGRNMIFDLDPDSRSLRILKEYLQERGFEVDFD